jgi:hypothetical protein
MAEIEIKNGILGVKRDILMSLVDLMILHELCVKDILDILKAIKKRKRKRNYNKIWKHHIQFEFKKKN